MKFTINQNKDITDVEIIINCPYIDDDIRQLIDCVHQYAGTLLGYIDSEMYSVPLNRILYIECTDKKTFFYDEKCVYLCRETISALEKSLSKAFFIRVSKNFIINLNQLLCLQPSDNHKLEAVMKNGEHIIVSRSYAQSLKNQFTMSDSKHPILDKYSGKVDLPQIEHAHRSVFNLGRILNLYHTPERVLALSYGEAEIMAALGLTNNLTAIAPAECSLQDVLPRFRAELSSIPVMLNNNIGIPNSESIQELHIDFILGTAFSRYSHRQVYESAKLDNMFYIFEATARECATLESLYHDVLNLGRIFHVENRAMSIVEKARKKVAAILGNFRIKTYKKVFVYDSGMAVFAMSFGGTSTFMSTLGIPGAAFIGALLSLVLVYTLSLVHGKSSSSRLLLSGIAVSLILNALTQFFILLAPEGNTKNALYWMLGSLGGGRWQNIVVPLIFSAIGFVFSLVMAPILNILSLGDETAVTIGVNVNFIRKLILIVVSLVTGGLVASSGCIGFVGLMIPHIARMLFGSDHRKTVISSFLIGAIFLIWMDVGARTILAPSEISIGILTAFCGGPFFIGLMRKKKMG